MGKKLLVTLAILSFIEHISATSVICYHGTWSNYRPGAGKFPVSAVPAHLCTHYIYAFVGLDTSTSKVRLLDEWLDVGLSGFATAVGLKSQNPSLKVLLAIGGWNEGSERYSIMAADPAKRATFIASALSIVQTYGFDGFDIDWEYPGRRDSSNAADKENFSSLLKEFRAAFGPLGLLLTAAVSSVPSSVDISYDVPVLAEYLDFINVMTYDFHGAWDTNVNHNSPLYSSARLADTEFAEFSVDVSIQGWLARGATPSKVALGVPFYGRTFQLSSSSSVAPGAVTTGSGGPVGPYTATSGFWGYNEIIEKFNEGGWTKVWDDEQQVPYAYKGTTWLSYDNPESLALKVAYAKSLGLGAIMLWSLETEDFTGLSGTQYPLLTAINNALGTSIVLPTAATTTTTTTAAPADSDSVTTTTTQSSGAVVDPAIITDANSCTTTGFFRSSTACNIYYYCAASGSGYTSMTFVCNGGLMYDTTLLVCNWPEQVTC